MAVNKETFQKYLADHKGDILHKPAKVSQHLNRLYELAKTFDDLGQILGYIPKDTRKKFRKKIIKDMYVKACENGLFQQLLTVHEYADEGSQEKISSLNKMAGMANTYEEWFEVEKHSPVGSPMNIKARGKLKYLTPPK